MNTQAVETIKKGEFVKRKADAKGVFTRGDYDKVTKRYSLVDTEDHCREVWVKKGTMLFVGFDY
jgi:hypothetical protein